MSTAFQTAATITLATNDTIPSDTLTYTIVTSPASGTLDTVNGNQVTYTPFPGFVGPDTFTYNASNGTTNSNTATVTITVLPVPPVANVQSVTVSYNTATQITLNATSTGTLTYTVVAQPANGTLTGTAPNLTYTPAPGYSGGDSFTFKATDSYNQDSLPTTVTISVMSAGAAPVAASQSVTVSYNTATPITLSATGTSTLTYTVVAPPLEWNPERHRS